MIEVRALRAEGEVVENGPSVALEGPESPGDFLFALCAAAPRPLVVVDVECPVHRRPHPALGHRQRRRLVPRTAPGLPRRLVRFEAQVPDEVIPSHAERVD
jgi:hypothetical protein